MVLYGLKQYCTILPSIAWYSMIMHGTAWYCKVLHGLADPNVINIFLLVLNNTGSKQEELDVCKARSRKARYFGLEVGKAGSGMGQKQGKLEVGKAQSRKLEGES